MQKRNVLSSPRLSELKLRRRKALLNKILLSLLALFATVALLVYISRLSLLNIKSVEINGNKVVETEMIKEDVDEAINSQYLWLFPKTNILIYPKSGIKKELSKKLKRLGDINLSIKDGKILEISVSEREGVYTWCGPTYQETANNDQKCYFLDKDGYIFDEAPYFSGEVYFKFYGPVNLTEDAPTGSYFLPGIFPKFIAFKEILENMKLKPVIFYTEENAKENSDAKVFLSQKTPSLKKPELIFKIDSDFKKVAENLQAALNTEPLQSKFKNKYSSLQYIDLRYGNKVYFKFK